MDYEYEIEEGEDLLLTLQFTIPPNLNQNSNQRSLRPLPHRQDGHARAFLELIQQNASQLATIAIQSWIDLNNDQASDTPKKASDLAFKSLQRIHVLSEKRRLKHVLCAICQDEFPNKTCFENAKTVESSVDSSVNTEQIIRMPCHHLYHESCLAGWLNNNSTCPTCRYEIPTDSEEYNLKMEERMKERQLQLDTQCDTDDEFDGDEFDGDGTTGSNSLKRKRNLSEDDSGTTLIENNQDSSKGKSDNQALDPNLQDTRLRRRRRGVPGTESRVGPSISQDVTRENDNVGTPEQGSSSSTSRYNLRRRAK